jgi:4-alpha-glucanotransferase
VNTHDLPPLMGWFQERDLAIRTEVGDLANLDLAAAMRHGRASDRAALVEALIEAGLLPPDAREHVTPDALIAAVHTFIRRTPAALVGLSLDDLAHESTPVNIPGVWQDRYPSWSRRMRETIESLIGDARTEQALG